jgi:outer membrane protein TolC
MTMKKINRWLILLLCVPTASFAQQNNLLQKYRSMAIDYNHDLKAADKNIAASIELEKAAQKDLRPKLSGDANFQYTGNPLQLDLDLPSMQNPMTFEGRNMKYGASLSLLQPVYTGGRLLENIRLAKHQQSLATYQADYFRSAVCYQTDMQYWNTVARSEIVRVTTNTRKANGKNLPIACIASP